MTAFLFIYLATKMSKNAKRKRPAEEAGKDSDEEDVMPAFGDAHGNRQVRGRNVIAKTS